MEKSESRSQGRTGQLWELFWFFFKTGFCTFGGGWSIVAQIRKAYVEEKGFISDEELLDITSVGRSLPGLMIGNVSYLFGYHAAGLPGALVCLIGITVPSVIVLTAVTWCYTLIRDNLYVSRAMAGVRAAVVPIILTSALNLRKAALPDQVSWLFLILAFVLNLCFGVNCALIVIASGFLGTLLCVWRERRKGDNRHGAA